jgi:hypothetical protein
MAEKVPGRASRVVFLTGYIEESPCFLEQMLSKKALRALADLRKFGLVENWKAISRLALLRERAYFKLSATTRQ